MHYEPESLEAIFKQTEEIGAAFGPFAHATVSPHGIEPRFRNDARVHRPFEDFSEQRPFRVLYVSIVDVYKHQWHLAEAAARLEGCSPFPAQAPPARKRMRGEVTERLKELAWKASTAHKAVGGSNPPLSASSHGSRRWGPPGPEQGSGVNLVRPGREQP